MVSNVRPQRDSQSLLLLKLFIFCIPLYRRFELVRSQKRREVREKGGGEEEEEEEEEAGWRLPTELITAL